MKTIQAALAIACAGGVAHADISANDITNASQLNINRAKISLNGVSFDPVRLGASLPKAAGTLTFDIPASALGIPIANLSVHAIGAPIGNGKIFFQTYNNYKPAITLPDGSTLDSELGTFTLQTWSLGGAESPICGTQPCAGGTGFQVIGGTMTATGSFGTMAVTLESRGVGGVTRAKLGKLKSPSVHLNANGAPELPVCSGAQETRALMKIALGSTAPAGGARVDLTSTATSLRFAHSLWVAPGTDTAAVEVAIPAGFTGIATMTAAAGGKTGTATLDVRPARECAPPPRHFALERMGNCIGCTEFGSLNNEGDRIVALDGTVNFVHAGTSMPLVKLFGGATWVGASSINNAGQIAGRFTRNGVTQAYRADMLDGSHQPVPLGAMTPMAITQGGTVVGFRDNPTTGKHIAVINRGAGVVDLPLTSGYGVQASRALFMTQDTTIVGTYTGNDNVVRGYRYRDGVTTTLPMIGGSWAIPTGVNVTNGAIAVNAGIIAAVVSKNGAVTQYGSPHNYAGFVVKDINKWGYAVGTATCTTCTNAIERAFVYIPGSGFTALSSYLSNLAYADDALAINDDNQIAIHGALVGNTTLDYFLLSL